MVRTGKIDLGLGLAGFRERERFGARAGGGLDRADPRTRRAGAGARGGVGAERHPGDLRELALRQVQGEAAQGLVAVGPGEVEDEGAELAGYRFGDAALEAGAEALAAAFGDLHLALAGDGRVVGVRGEGEVGGEAAAVVGVLQRCPRPAPDVEVDLFDGNLGKVGEDRGEAAGLLVGF